MIHDTFQPLSYWDGFMPYPNWQGVIIDTHIYQMFSQSVILFLVTSFKVYSWHGFWLSWCRKQMHNTSPLPVVSFPTSRTPRFGPLSGNGPPLPMTVRNILTVVVQEPDTTAAYLARPLLEVVTGWQDRPLPSAQVTRHSWGNIGKPRLRPTNKGIKDGFNGHGRPRMPMNGPTRLVWPMDGYLKILPTTNTLTYVDEEMSFRDRLLNLLSLYLSPLRSVYDLSIFIA